MANAKIDDNRTKSLLGVSSVDSLTPVAIEADPVLKALCVSVSGGTVTANLSATDNAVLDTIDTAIDAINTKLVTGTVIGDVNLGATDNAVLDALATSLAIIDDWDSPADHCNIRHLNATDDTLVIAAGTSAIGKTLPNDTDVTAHTYYARKYYTSAGAATDGIIWSPAANTRWHVVTMYIQVSAAATVTLEDDKAGGDDPVWKGELAANSGVVLSFTEHYPMASGEDAADLTITTSAGNCYVTCVGYEI